ncbi:MAG: hypothetical protein NC489_46880, partial [Ruminococcus flavefaciens]|nr:hypothetical protein [Ruminococcus flavefaciens]
MDKNKRLFLFRKHPVVGDILKGGKGKKLKRGMGILLAAALLFNTLPSGALTAAASEDSGTGLCEHHTEHTEDCGYAKAHECTFVCGECGSGEDAEDNNATASDAADTESLEEIPDEETTEVIKSEDAEADDTSLCSRHKEHTEDCGFVPASEDGEGKPCTYECRICPIEDLIAALPDEVTEDNAKEVRAQLDEILSLYRELNEDEQEQIDMTLCSDLLAALDEANTPMPLSTGNVEIPATGADIRFTADECAGGCQGHTITQSTTVGNAYIIVESGIHDVTFSNLNITPNAHVGVMPGATMNLILEGSNTIQGYDSGIYVPEGATLVINGNGTLNVSASGSAAGIGGAFVDPSDSTGSTLGNLNCGTIVINGGTITATGGSLSAGIGGVCCDGYYIKTPGNGGNVTINGGTVTATGGGDSYEGGAGIGGGIYNGKSGSGGTLTINGGNVTLTAGHSTAYGFGRGSGTNNINAGTLTLADASYLTLTDGTALDPKGTYSINGDPTPDMIVVPENLVYTGNPLDVSGIRIDDSKTGTATYFGQTFKVSASADGWVLQDLGEVVNTGTYTAVFKKGDKTISKTFTVVQSGTEFMGDGVAKAYLNGVETTSFTADDTITVKATPTATGQAPANAAMMIASLDEPTGGQMALFVGDTQVSAPVDADTDGTYTMTASASDVLAAGNVEPNGAAITLTAKFVGNDNMADAAATLAVNITAVAKVESGGDTTYYGTLQAAWRAAGGKTATVTLLDNVTAEERLTTIFGDNTTINGTGKTITVGGNNVFNVGSGSLTINGGTFRTASNSSCIFVGYLATLVVTDGTFEGQKKGLYVDSGGTAKLSGGTFTSSGITIDADGTNVGRLLLNYGVQSEPHYAYFDADDKPIALTNQTTLTGLVTVKVCKHNTSVCEYQHNNGTETHTMTCLACGY